jgi:hypothetical protein
VLGRAALASFMVALDALVVTTALTSIQRDLHATVERHRPRARRARHRGRRNRAALSQRADATSPYREPSRPGTSSATSG